MKRALVCRRRRRDGGCPELGGIREQRRARSRPGAPGIGDPYFPLAGNGGYDVGHYPLDIDYDPPTITSTASRRSRATATQDLSSFNLDFVGLNVQAITVDGWERRLDARRPAS